MVVESQVWSFGYMVVRRVGLRDGCYEDAVTGCRVPLAQLPEWAEFVANDIGGLPEHLREAIGMSSTRARAERQRADNHCDLLVALRVHAFQKDMDLRDLVDSVVPQHHRHLLFADTTIHVFHATHSPTTPFELAAIVTLPRRHPLDALACINTAINATTSQHGNWSLTTPTDDQCEVVPMLISEPSDTAIAGARPTQTGDLMVINGVTPFAMSEYGAVDITPMNINELGFDDLEVLRDLISDSLMPHVPPAHVQAAQLIAAISTLAGTVGASPDLAIETLQRKLTHRFFSDMAVANLVADYYAPEDSMTTTEQAHHHTQRLINLACDRWGMQGTFRSLRKTIKDMATNSLG